MAHCRIDRRDNFPPVEYMDYVPTKVTCIKIEDTPWQSTNVAALGKHEIGLIAARSIN